ncbi:MAG: 2-hydroxychromene-2-carboxylate isomerase [Deltaproteobacteria bacterium]|nr:2-hydroxychromene-2-carboxylate isomerase [Deltaproteobacteria bacterium]MBI3156653.1 2-hydroxychromene-2-carboxylate isomerase [Burkholderiales bacterium]
MIELWFDFSSPYGYLASTQIDAIARRHAREVVWKPFLLGAVMKVTGAVPLVAVPMKADYARRDLARTARHLGVPFAMPARFPSASRPTAAGFWAIASGASSGDGGVAEQARAYARAVYRMYFVEGRTPDSQEVALEAAASVGVDRDRFLAALAAGHAKLDAVTDEAKQRAIFGSPFIIVDGEPFWGADRLPMIERWLETGGF